MLRKRIGMFMRGLVMAGVLTFSACGGGGRAAGVSGNNSERDPNALLQFEEPQAGEELVVMHTNKGDIKLRLFPEEAPLAVENFLTLARQGYYDNVIFHRVIEGFMIQGGDPEGTGLGGESIYEGGDFGYEKSSLRHFRGALAMAHSSLPDSNGSQFYIVQSKEEGSGLDGLRERQDEDAFQVTTAGGYQQQVAAVDDKGNPIKWSEIFPLHVIDKYIEVGGTSSLDLHFNIDGHTVFGQVYEGMDVVDAIAAVETNSSDKPLEDVVIESITFEKVE
jgi:peptidyl-prolyl cis-trans isomerase B (cyclophilin B)